MWLSDYAKCLLYTCIVLTTEVDPLYWYVCQSPGPDDLLLLLFRNKILRRLSLVTMVFPTSHFRNLFWNDRGNWWDFGPKFFSKRISKFFGKWCFKEIAISIHTVLGVFHLDLLLKPLHNNYWAGFLCEPGDFGVSVFISLSRKYHTL